MHIRTFRAASLQDALEEIRQQMGSNASVLHTRQVRDGWMGWLGRTYVEVTAGLQDDSEPAVTLPMDSSPTAAKIDSRFAHFSDSTDHPNRLPLPATCPRDLGQFSHHDLPSQLQTYHQELRLLGVPPVTVDRWIAATTGFAANLGDSIPQPWLEHLQRSVARELRISGPIRTQPGDRRVVALVGPTGVGKTTTVAKLAAGFRIEAKRRVGLLTIDTFRIAAVQQLKAYAEIMDLPMEVVERAEQMQPALTRLGDVDLVLIDTAGRSPRSDARIEQLVELLRSAQPDETHLVLSATGSTQAIEAAVKGFTPVRPTAAILTKLDEAPCTASALCALTSSDHFSGIPISYITNGQQVPDDIATADANQLLSRLLPSQTTPIQIEAA